MKWVFLLGVLLSIPAFTIFFRSESKRLVQGCFVLGVSMFVLVPNVWAAPIAWPGWPGPVKGLEVSSVDGLAIAMILATRPVRVPAYIKIVFGLFCLALFVSTFVGSQLMPAGFYIVQVFRSLLLFLAVARACGSVKGAPVALLAGLGTGLLYEAVLTVQEHFSGNSRPGGNLGHSNFLGLASDFVTFPMLALFLGTRRLWPAGILFGSFVIALYGGSRATMGLFAIGVVLTLFLSILHGRSSRKFAFGFAALLLLLAAAPAMMWAVNNRSQQSLDASDAERDAMKLAAQMIIADHPLGVGPNQYVVVANTGGYSARAGVGWNFANRSAPVHDVYYLVTAEMGMLGLIGFMGTIVAFIGFGFRKLRQRSGDESNELMPGLLATMIVISVHISYEWVFMHFVLHYMFAVAGGMMVGVGALTWKSARSRSIPLAQAKPSHA